MGRASRAWTFQRKAQESQCEGLCEERSLLRTNGSPRDEETQSWRRALLSAMDYVCGLQWSWLGATRRLRSSGRNAPFDRMQAHPKPNCGDTTTVTIPSTPPGHISSSHFVLTSVQEFESGPEAAGGRAGGSIAVSNAGCEYLALPGVLSNARRSWVESTASIIMDLCWLRAPGLAFGLSSPRSADRRASQAYRDRWEDRLSDHTGGTGVLHCAPGGTGR